MKEFQKEISGCAVIKDGKLLLLHKIKNNNYEFPGGKIEDGETPEQTAMRETHEEIGCTPKILKKFSEYNYKIKKVKRSHVFLAEIDENPAIMEEDVFDGLIWMPIHNHKDYNLARNVSFFCEDYLSLDPQKGQ